MSRRTPLKDFIHLLIDLQSQEHVQRESIEEAALSPQLALLRQWQSQRLQRTYADLLVNHKSRPACEFFLSDIYAPRDFSQRDLDAENLYAILLRYLPASTLELLADAIRISQLSDRLDRQLLGVLVSELGVTDTITEELYAEAYRRCDNYAERLQQIELLVETLREVGAIARNPLAGIGARLARGPAQRAGWGELYGFLERGYAALKHVRSIDPVVDTIQERETRILDNIFAGAPDPFRLPT